MINMKRLLILAFFAVALLNAFPNVSMTGDTDSIYNGDSIYNNVEYPLPTIPNTLLLPQERAKYATSHFWDAYDAQYPCATNISCMQQAIANFAALAKMSGDGDLAAASVKILVEKSSKSEKAAGILSSAAEICLDDPESPVYDKDLYSAFISAFAHTDGLPRWITSKYTSLEELLQLNAVGSKAADFTLSLSNGTDTSLWKELGRDYTILILYDPDCSHCDIALKQFASEPIVDKWITSGMAKVIAADIRPSDRSQAKASTLPKNWVCGIDTTGIEDEEIYYVPATPSIYLIDATGIVILKDADPADVIEAIWTGKK